MVDIASEQVGNARSNLVPTTDGYLTEALYGRLETYEPPVKVTKERPNSMRGVIAEKQYKRPEQTGNNHSVKQAYDNIPGYKEWQFNKRDEKLAVMLQGIGRMTGHGVGMSKPQAIEQWNEAQKQAKKDMSEIKKVIDLNEAAEEALQTVLETMRGPVSAKEKLAAASKILEFTMAKPVAKSEVTVNAAEQWLASLREGSEESEE